MDTKIVDIRPLERFDPVRFRAIAAGYTTTEIYRVTREASPERVALELRLERLPEPREFRFPYDAGELAGYAGMTPGEYCLGAWDGALLVGVALAEPQAWNRTLWVWEFHVAEGYRGRGIGRGLMAELAGRAAHTGLRAVVCETQNTNVPAIRFYRAVGFEVDGIDISYYTNEDMEPAGTGDRGTVAVFMKLRLE